MKITLGFILWQNFPPSTPTGFMNNAKIYILYLMLFVIEDGSYLRSSLGKFQNVK